MSVPASGKQTPLLSAVVLVSDPDDGAEVTIASAARAADEVIAICVERDDHLLGQHPGRSTGSAARRIEHPWTYDFSAARNRGLAAAKGEYILMLDAGESIAPEAAEALRAFLQSSGDRNEAYLLLVEVPPSDGQFSSEQAARVRVISNRPDLRYAGRVRESLLPAIAEHGINLKPLSIKIARSQRDHDPRVRVARARREFDLAELQSNEQGEDCEMLLAKAEALAALGQQGAAAELFRQAIGCAARGSTAMLEAYYGLLTAFDSDPRAKDAQLAACLEGLEVYPLDAQLLCGMGSYMLAQNRPDLAARSYSIAVAHGQIDPQTWHLADIGQVAATCLSLTQQLLGSDEEAQQTLEQTLVRFPESQRLRRQLINLHIKHARSAAAMAEFDRLPSNLPDREALRCAIRGGLLAAQRNWVAALPYLQTAHQAGCRDPLCLRWLSVTLLSTGDVDAARPVLEQWQQTEPGNGEAAAYLAAIAVPMAKPAMPAPNMVTPSTADDPSRRTRVDRAGSGSAGGAAPVQDRPRTDMPIPNLNLPGSMLGSTMQPSE